MHMEHMRRNLAIMDLRPYWNFSFTRENVARQISLQLNLPPQSPAAAIELFDSMNVCMRNREMSVSILDGRTLDIRPLRTGQVVHSQFERGILSTTFSSHFINMGWDP